MHKSTAEEQEEEEGNGEEREREARQLSSSCALFQVEEELIELTYLCRK